MGMLAWLINLMKTELIWVSNSRVMCPISELASHGDFDNVSTALGLVWVDANTYA